MDQILQNKVAIITGATAGIGRNAAILFAKKGAKVVVTGRRDKEGEETVRLIKDAGGTALFVKCDVSQEKDNADLVAKTLKTYGRLDIAFNNAGVFGKEASLLELTEDDYKYIFDINVKGIFLSMKYQIPAMLKSGGGSIINNASVAGIIGIPDNALYAASKAAVISLTKSLALAYAKQNIRVNAVAPAGVETEMLTTFIGDKKSEKAENFKNLHPMGRFGTSDEIAEGALFLASQNSSFITGQTLVLDGGFTIP